MTTLFVSAVDGNNGDDGLAWATAKQTVNGALAIAADGDVIKVDSAGTFTATAAITWTLPASRVAIISVNRASADAWLAGAIEEVGAASAAFAVNGLGGTAAYVYGMTLNGGTNANAACDISLLANNNVSAKLEMALCTLDIKAASTGAVLALGIDSQTSIILRDCTLIASGSRAGPFISLSHGRVEIINPTIVCSGATKPAALFQPANGAAMLTIVRDGDLSGYGTASGAYVDVSLFSAVGSVLFKNLKLSATPTITTGAWPAGFGEIVLRNCDSGDTINTFEYRNAYGTLTENTSIFAASGAEFNGAGISWQVVTTAACNESLPFSLPVLNVWNTVTASQTATVEVVKDGATDLTDREIWLELSYPASASFSNHASDDDRNANPFTGTAVDQPNSSTSWTGTGGFGAEDKQTLDVAFTAAEVGVIEGRVSVAKASTTLCIDPILRGLTAGGDDIWFDLGAMQLPAAIAGHIASRHRLGM